MGLRYKRRQQRGKGDLGGGEAFAFTTDWLLAWT
jgi:hypothetical protein